MGIFGKSDRAAQFVLKLSRSQRGSAGDERPQHRKRQQFGGSQHQSAALERHRSLHPNHVLDEICRQAWTGEKVKMDVTGQHVFHLEAFGLFAIAERVMDCSIFEPAAPNR